jgi:hypothetical protein
MSKRKEILGDVPVAEPVTQSQKRLRGELPEWAKPDTNPETNGLIDECPVCGERAYRVSIGPHKRRTCRNGHSWYWDNGQRVPWVPVKQRNREAAQEAARQTTGPLALENLSEIAIDSPIDGVDQ